MKIYLIDPNKKWYKANLHCHTNYSDGYFSLKEIKKHYMEHGYSIVAFSDHEIIYDQSNLTDKNFVALTSVEYSINSDSGKTIHLCMFSKDSHNIDQLGDSNIQSGRFYFIRGQKNREQNDLII